MGHIDPKLIADAAPDVEQKKSTNKTWVKWASLAACLCLMIMVSIAYFMGNDTPDIPSVNYPGYTETSSFYYEGDVCENEFATIVHKGFDETSITLSIDKKTDDTLTIAFRGWDANSSVVLTNNISDLVLYVNVEKADEMPTAPGKYEVKIDYSIFASKCDTLDGYMYVSGFGYFSLNGEGNNLAGIDAAPLTICSASENKSQSACEFTKRYNNKKYGYVSEKNDEIISKHKTGGIAAILPILLMKVTLRKGG